MSSKDLTSPPPNKKIKVAEHDQNRSNSGVSMGFASGRSFSVESKKVSKDATPPYVMCFPQGPPPTGVLTDDDNGLCFTTYVPKDPQYEGIQIRARANNFPVEYHGSSNSGDSEQSQYWVGVYNKKTKKVQIIPTPALFPMQQVIAGKQNDIVDRKYADLDYIAQRSMLINSFASTRRKRLLSTMVANRVNDQTSFGVEVAQIENQVIQSSGSIPTPESRPDLPFFNATAQSAEEIYPFTSLAPIDDIDFIISSKAPCVKAIEDPDEAKTLLSKLPPCTHALFHALQSAANASRATGNAKSEDYHQKRAALLQYLVYLVLIFNTQERSHHSIIRPSAEKLVPSTILNGILSKFASAVPENKKKFILSSVERSKLLNYIAIIALTLSDYSLPINSLATDLTLSVSQLRLHFELAGCKVAAKKLTEKEQEELTDDKKQIFVAKLTAPLVLPNQAKRMAKKNK